jgi:hypothetical protein
LTLQFCINCPAEADVTIHLASGRLAHLCDRCARRLAPQSVYFIRVGDRVKIGLSRDVERRLRAHQISSPDPLSIWHLVEGDLETERRLHRQFADARIRGEWFRITPEIEAFVSGGA